jgi:serine/threonine protein kinase
MVNGDIIGAGGFGCIFKPPLKCKSKKQANKKNISKLITRKNGMKEYSISHRILKLIKKIPKYKEYFILDGITKCSPEKIPITYKSKIGKCIGMLGTDDIGKINQRISNREFLLLNVPYGGVSLLDLLTQMTFSGFRNKKIHDSFCELIDNLIELLLNAVVKMRGVGVYHNDLKADNILYVYNPKKKRNCYRIIDWGVSVTTRSPEKVIDIGRRPIQWNSTLYAPFLMEPLYSSLHTIRYEIKGKNSEQCGKILEKYLQHSSGQINYIDNNIFPILKYNRSYKSNLNIGDVLKGQIDKILRTFDLSSKDKNYFISNILSHNIDIHGFISIFIDLIIINHSKGRSCTDHPLFGYLQGFIWKYFYSDEFVVNRINLDELIYDIFGMKYI